MSKDQPKRILILGGGFAGLYAAMELEKTVACDPDVEVALVNRENFFLFTPMLHEVAASDLDITTIVNPVRRMLKRVNFFAGEVESVDLENRRVEVSHGFDRHGHSLEYDFLVLGLGSITNFYNLPGLEPRALTMKSLGDAMTLRNRLIAHLEEADSECCKIKEPLLTFIVAGGGFAGVETVAGINDFLRDALPSYPHLREQLLRVVSVHPGPVILPELGEKLGAYARKKLAARKVEIRVNTKVTAVSDEGVELSDGTMIEGKTIIWTAGTSPHPLVQALPCVKERGRVLTNEYLELGGWPGVWALGDCAAVPDPKTGKTCPPTAQHALRQGKVVAHNICAAVRGGGMKKFTFSTLGQLAAIGKRTGVANILGLNFSGFIAWWLWRTIYLSKLPGIEKKVRVGLDWTLDLLFSQGLGSIPDGARAQRLTARRGRGVTRRSGVDSDSELTSQLRQSREVPVLKALKQHWPEYLMEAGELGAFMVSACVVTVILWHPGSSIGRSIPDPAMRRLLTGNAMGLTAILIIRSPWGQQSGAHFNPSVTLTFFRLGKIDPWDALFYVTGQFAGAVAGVTLVASLLGMAPGHPAVRYAATVPGPGGARVAFIAEFCIAFLLMLVILTVSNTQRLARFTPFFAATLVATYISLEAPLSGMSMNPARSFGSAVAARLWTGLWIYFTAPPLGMLAAAQLYLAVKGARGIMCAKLDHHNNKHCIFRCGYKQTELTTQ